MTKLNTVTAFAPATVANVGCGYDIMGFAIEGIGDSVTITINDTADQSDVILKGPFGKLIPSARSRNTAAVAVNAFLQHIGKSDLRLEIILEKNMPLGSGMGSSASSSAAAVFALNHLLGYPLSTSDLIPFAMEGERIACGSAHADNVAPSLLGGFTLIRSYKPLDIITVACPDDLCAVVVHPHIELNTSDSRRVLNRDVPVEHAIIQSANTAGFMVALLTSDFGLLQRSMTDMLAEPRRIRLIPGFESVRKAAIGKGAIGCGISGSGPSVFALCIGQHVAVPVADAMKKAFSEIGLENEAYISRLNAAGAGIVE